MATESLNGINVKLIALDCLSWPSLAPGREAHHAIKDDRYPPWRILLFGVLVVFGDGHQGRDAIVLGGVRRDAFTSDALRRPTVSGRIGVIHPRGERRKKPVKRAELTRERRML